MNILNKIFGQKSNSVNEKINSPNKSFPDFERLDDFGQIIPIFDYVFNPNDSIAQKAAETIHRLFTQVTVFKNKELYETFRYLRVDITDINKFDRFPNEIKISLLCIASLNGNGYSREKALDKLIGINEKRIFPFVLFRLADWVGPIREKAESIVEEYLSQDNAVFFIQNHKLINWLLKVYRKDLSVLYKKIITLITNKRFGENELKGLKEGERFFYYKSVIQSQTYDSKIIESILSDKYYLVRLLLIGLLDKIPEKKYIISKLLADKAQKIRQSAVNWISDNDIVDFQPILEALIYDSSASVRFESRKLLSRLGDWNFINLYKGKIEKEECLVGSILGLSEVGSKVDIPLIRDFLEFKIAKIKTASLIGLYNLDNNLATEISYQIIEQKSPASTKKAAEMILLKQGIEINRLRALYDLTDYSGKKVVLRLINKFGGWSAAGDYLKALTENDDRLIQFARISLEAWDRYTIRLGTKQTKDDKDYVLTWYENVQNMGLQVPTDIPFIFGEK